MTNQEAKFTLGAYRAGGQDAGDPVFAEALEQAKRDPALGAWLAREQAHDTIVAAKLREVAPPAGLRAAILAGAQASSTRRVWWKQPVWLAAAAAVALLLAVVGTISRGERGAGVPATALAELVLADLNVAGHVGHDTASGELKAWLEAPGKKLAASSGLDFAQMKAKGCRTLTLGGRELAEVCFERNGLVFHLYTMPRTALPELTLGAKPTLVAQAGKAAAVWSDEKLHYVLATGAGLDAIKQLL